MPGPTYIRGKLVQRALACGKLFPSDIDDRVREVLKLVNKVLPLGIPERAEEKSVDTKKTAQTLRDIAAASIVLKKIDRNVLPFDKKKSVGGSVIAHGQIGLTFNRSQSLAPMQKLPPTVVVVRRPSNHTMPLRPSKASQLKPKSSNMPLAAQAT